MKPSLFLRLVLKKQWTINERSGAFGLHIAARPETLLYLREQ